MGVNSDSAASRHTGNIKTRPAMAMERRNIIRLARKAFPKRQLTERLPIKEV